MLVALAASVHTAVRYAAKHPDTVDALVLVAGSSTARPFPPALVQKLADEDWDGFLYLLARGDRSHEATLQAVAYYKRMVDRADYMVRTNEYVRSSVEDQLALLTVPTLVIHPREVHAPSYEDSAELASKIADSRLVVVGGGGPTTIGTMGGDPEATIAAIEAFLADLPPRPLQAKAPGTNSLSARELEVLRLLAQGKSNPEIAKQLFITRNTVQNHVSSILIKTNLTNRTEAAVYAKEHGLV
jgi:DNA-binding CsgD family transcriptional regulator